MHDRFAIVVPILSPMCEVGREEAAHRPIGPLDLELMCNVKPTVFEDDSVLGREMLLLFLGHLRLEPFDAHRKRGERGIVHNAIL